MAAQIPPARAAASRCTGHVHVHDGARISQAVAMHPDRHLRLDQNMVCIPAAKGHDDRWITVPQELVRNWRRCLDFIRAGSSANRII
jgi:hypothetical protein